MIGLEGNRVALYQWDLNQRLVLSGVKENTEVHFYVVNDNKDESYKRKTYKDGQSVYANIPNLLLQKSGTINVCIYLKEGDKASTRQDAAIIVLPRDKPSDYEYDEEEGVGSLDALEKRVEELEKATISSLPPVTVEDDGKVLSVKDGEWVAKDLPVYDGSYSVVPSNNEQVLNTSQKFVDADIKVEKIPYAEVTNMSGGITATIGGE